jgi:hypothetical protein
MAAGLSGGDQGVYSGKNFLMRDHRRTRGVDTTGYLATPRVRFRVGLERHQ